MLKVFLQKTMLTILAVSFAWMLTAQDIHFSQSKFSPLNISPGFTGMFPQDIRFMGSYRSQWQSVPVPYVTFSGAADMKLPNLLRGNEKFKLAGGLLFNYDQQGDSELTATSFGIMGAIHYKIDEQNTISFGVQSAVAQRSFSLDRLQFNNQYDGDIFNSSLDSKENFSNQSKAFVDIGAGLSWMLKSNENRSKVYAGFGFFHLNAPNQSFKDVANSNLPLRLAILSRGVVEVHSKWDWILFAQGQIQNPYEELLVGSSGRYHISQAKGKEIAIELGTTFRVGDAIIPTMELHYAAWQVGVSYDFNISKFETATDGNGGIELGIIYTITNVKPIDVFESCPVF